MPKKATKKKEETSTEAKVEEPTVTIIKTAQAAKLSPRGDGLISYQLARRGDALLLRISGNESSGRFSKEWVAVEKIRDALSKIPKGTESFKTALLLRAAWKGKSSCNGGFAAAIFVAENVFAREDNPKKKSMLKLSSPDAIEVWEKKVLEMPVPEDAEVVPLFPPKPKPFRKKAEGDGAGEPQGEPTEPTEGDNEDGAGES